MANDDWKFEASIADKLCRWIEEKKNSRITVRKHKNCY
jgi:hypothetical protein